MDVQVGMEGNLTKLDVTWHRSSSRGCQWMWTQTGSRARCGTYATNGCKVRAKQRLLLLYTHTCLA